MARSTIKYLKRQGRTNTEIAQITGHHRNTVSRILDGPTEPPPPPPRPSKSSVVGYEAQIQEWLVQKLSVKRMLELARQDKLKPYQGGATAFYDYVRKLKMTQGKALNQAWVRFEGLPGEFLQIDRGEIRNFPFTKAGMSQSQTRYFFCARLKYSRFMWVRFETNMQEETLLRCLVDCFVALGGVPWAVVSDNMKTVVLGRDEQHQPRWNKAYLKLATEFEFHPELCAPASGNQKGSVENLVKFVKGNFVAGRTFYDEADLAHQLGKWLHTVNTERKSEATGQIPAHLLRLEQSHFGPLPPHSRDYGLFHSVTVSRESLVCFETNFYSVP